MTHNNERPPSVPTTSSGPMAEQMEQFQPKPKPCEVHDWRAIDLGRRVCIRCQKIIPMETFPMSETMVERVAKAMLACEAWSSFWSMDEAKILARAAIEALRDYIVENDIGFTDAWVVTLNAALAEGKHEASPPEG